MRDAKCLYALYSVFSRVDIWQIIFSGANQKDIAGVVNTLRKTIRMKCFM